MKHFVVIDLEMCAVPKKNRSSFRCKNETIEIGAVLLDKALNICDTFKTYVHPEFGVIDSYIINLTGITTKQTDAAPTFTEAMKMFLEWLPEDCVLVAWSDNDKAQLQKEAFYKGFEYPGFTELLEDSLDCQVDFSEKMNSPKTYSLSEALIIADIAYDEGAHDALVDAHNTALLFAKMQKQDILELNPYYNSAQGETHLTYNPFADLLSKLSTAG